MKHTPAPWKLVANTKQGFRAPSIYPVSTELSPSGTGCLIPIASDVRNEDAALIAAAPELLEMLIKCVDAVEYHHEQTHCDGDFDLKAAVHALIRKAGGAA